MFGHGQVEGFAERYGMEYKRAYWDETPDSDLISRHEREIFPLLQRRWLFADVEQFALYDFESSDGGVDEDVYAYSNRVGDARGLVVVHNKWKETRGSIMTAAAAVTAGGVERKPIHHALGLRPDAGIFTRFRDVISGLEFLRPNDRIAREGFHFTLQAFEYHAFVDFREVTSTREEPYAELAKALGDAGTRNLDEALVNVRYRGLHEALYEATNSGSAAWLFSGSDASVRLDGLIEKVANLAKGLDYVLGTSLDAAGVMATAKGAREHFLNLEKWVACAHGSAERHDAPTNRRSDSESPPAIRRVARVLGVPHESLATALVFALTLGPLAKAASLDAADVTQWHTERAFARAFENAGATTDAANKLAGILRVVVSNAAPRKQAALLVREAFTDDFLRPLLGVNLHEGTLWFDRDSFDALLEVFAHAAAASGQPFDDEAVVTLRALAVASGYELEAFVASLPTAKSSATSKAPPKGSQGPEST